MRSFLDRCTCPRSSDLRHHYCIVSSAHELSISVFYMVCWVGWRLKSGNLPMLPVYPTARSEDHRSQHFNNNNQEKLSFLFFLHVNRRVALSIWLFGDRFSVSRVPEKRQTLSVPKIQ